MRTDELYGIVSMLTGGVTFALIQHYIQYLNWPVHSLDCVILCLSSDQSRSAVTLSDDKLLNLCTLAYSENVDLQRSAALCFSEISERRMCTRTPLSTDNSIQSVASLSGGGSL